jgi:hypothetical protein
VPVLLPAYSKEHDAGQIAIALMYKGSYSRRRESKKTERRLIVNAIALRC